MEDKDAYPSVHNPANPELGIYPVRAKMSGKYNFSTENKRDGTKNKEKINNNV
jgi:hypothetical protein